MGTVGQIERRTQSRVVKLFRDTLGYSYLGDWQDREVNRNVEEEWLRPFLKNGGWDENVIGKTIFELKRAAENTSKSLYDRNRDVYSLLRYGVNVLPGVGEQHKTVKLIDWENPERNHFGIAEEVAVTGIDWRAHNKRPDLVLYVNGIALGVLELKRSTVSVAEGIRQNLDNQKREFIEHFFSTIQLIMAGNDTEGMRYGSIGTPEKYYLTWKEPSEIENPLDRSLIQMCNKARLLELIHDFIVFDAGIKKLCRHNQYFGVKAAQEHVKRRDGGIIWHTQGSGKSLTMVWLAKWLRENVQDPRVLVITDRTELDEQIEKIFFGVDEQIYRTTSGQDLIGQLNSKEKWLICSLIHKFGRRENATDEEVEEYVRELKKALPKNFQAKGNLFIFVDECHRTQSGKLHDAMKDILPNALFIGFTGTPLLRDDKKRSIEIFGHYIHTYKFDDAVKDGVVLDLRYEARNIDQYISSPDKIDQWFELKTRSLTDLAKAQLKQRWGTMQKLLSSRDRLEKIVADILVDMETRDRLMSGHGNALLVSGSIYQACKLYQFFREKGFKGKCAIVTSYNPGVSQIKGEETGEGETEKLEEYQIYRQMLAEWFNENEEKAAGKVEEFERQVKEKFIKEPGQMKLLIVVNKLTTGFDAPSATYLYLDKQMQDHQLFQTICRVNRLDGEDKDYGYIIDYKDLFRSLEGAMQNYTSGAFDKFDKEDVAGLLQDRLKMAREKLEEKREVVKALCEKVEPPQDTPAFIRYFCSREAGNAEQLKENESKRLALYRHVAEFIRAYANIANEYEQAGYTSTEIGKIEDEVAFYEAVRNEIKLASGDAIDLKLYEPAMRHLIDCYIQARDSEKVTSFDDLSLIQLIVERGPEAVKALPERIQKSQQAVAETIENNVRILIIDEHPVNPKYYDKMSELLDALIEERKQEAISYQEYLKKVTELTRRVKNPAGPSYPISLNTVAKRNLYDNLDNDEALALAVDEAVRNAMQDDWKGNPFKKKRVKIAIKQVIQDEARAEEIFHLVTSQHEY